MYSILWSKRQKITDLMEAQKTPCYKKYLLMQETPVCWKRDRLPTPVFLGFPCGSAGKESTCSVGDLGSIPRLRRSPGGGHGNPLQHSYLVNPHGQRTLAGYSPWGHKELDMTQRLSTAQHIG